MRSIDLGPAGIDDKGAHRKSLGRAAVAPVPIDAARVLDSNPELVDATGNHICRRIDNFHLAAERLKAREHLEVAPADEKPGSLTDRLRSAAPVDPPCAHEEVTHLAFISRPVPSPTKQHTLSVTRRGNNVRAARETTGSCKKTSHRCFTTMWSSARSDKSTVPSPLIARPSPLPNLSSEAPRSASRLAEILSR